MEEVVQRCSTGEVQVRDNPEEVELGPVDDVCMHCKKNFIVLFYIGKKKRVRTIHSGRVGKGPVPLRKLKKSGRKESWEIDFVCRKYSMFALSLQ